MSKTRRIASIIAVLLIPVTVMWNTFNGMENFFTVPRIMRRVQMLLMPELFSVWTIALGIIVFSWYRWFKRPAPRTFWNMFQLTVALGIFLIWVVWKIFAKGMPGDGLIP